MAVVCDNVIPSTFINVQNEAQYYGGFQSGMMDKSLRDLAAFPVIISGDIGTQNDNSDNTYSVVSFSALADTTCVFDGFTIMDGNANGTNPSEMNGGGISIIGGSPQLRNITITGNACIGNGGGIYIEGGSPILENINCNGNTGGTGESVFINLGNVEYKGINNID